MNRHLARQLVIQTLYQIEVGQIPAASAMETIQLRLAELKEEATALIIKDLIDPEDFQLEKEFALDEFYFKLVNGIVDNQEKIDETIAINLTGWNFNRLNKVDRAIIRLATYEMLYEKGTPPQVIINEALELTKEFSETGDKKARSFNNKLLDQINQYISKSESDLVAQTTKH